MIYPDVSAEEWAKRYKLVPETVPCHRCRVDQTLSIPFATGTLRGLMAPTHECGEKYRSFLYRDTYPQRDAAWRGLHRTVTEGLQ